MTFIEKILGRFRYVRELKNSRDHNVKAVEYWRDRWELEEGRVRDLRDRLLARNVENDRLREECEALETHANFLRDQRTVDTLPKNGAWMCACPVKHASHVAACSVCSRTRPRAVPTTSPVLV